MPTPNPLISPSDLAQAPDLDGCRPRRCRCGACPPVDGSRVGMHGDGLTRRRVPWPILLAGELVIDWVVAVGRRYRCPDCRGVTTVSHPGLRDGATYGTVVIAALLYIIADRPLGWGWDEEAAYELARGRPLSAGERARTGRPRWWSIRRWLRDLDDLWGPVGAGSVRQRIHAVVAGFGVGRPLHEVLDRIPHAHAHGGLAM